MGRAVRNSGSSNLRREYQRRLLVFDMVALREALGGHSQIKTSNHCHACRLTLACPSQEVIVLLHNCGAYLHGVCFMQFAVWLEEQTSLVQILRAWYRHRRAAHNARAEKVFTLVLEWRVGALAEGCKRHRESCWLAWCMRSWKSYADMCPDLTSSSSESGHGLAASSSSSSDFEL